MKWITLALVYTTKAYLESAKKHTIQANGSFLFIEGELQDESIDDVLKGVDYESEAKYIEILSLLEENLEEVPTSIERFVNLKRLYLDYNHIEKINSDRFKNLTQLETLSLDCNEIKEIGKDTFENLPELKVLNLESNKISKIDKDAFKNNEKLEELNLSGNELTEIDYSTFENLPNLKMLDLQHNKSLVYPESIGELKELTNTPGLYFSPAGMEEYNTRMAQRFNKRKDLDELTSLFLKSEE